MNNPKTIRQTKQSVVDRSAAGYEPRTTTTNGSSTTDVRTTNSGSVATQSKRMPNAGMTNSGKAGIAKSTYQTTGTRTVTGKKQSVGKTITQNGRERALDIALTQIDKQFGRGSVMKMGEKGDMNVESVSTGAIALDMALGIGGLPRGRITEIFGPESSGKSTLATHVVAEAQRQGGICVYVDAEHAMDPVYAKAIGVNIDEMLISQPDTGEQALEITDMLVRSSAIDVVVIDSVAALTPKAELEGDMGDTHVGLQARLMSQALRKLTSNLSKSKTICIFINQLREKIGVMFGSPETTTGGRALKFYSSVRLDIRRIESLKDGTEIVGNRVRVKVVKNKCAPPFRQAEFDIMYGRGISKEGSVLDIGVTESIIRKSGAWYTYEGQQLGQGRGKAKKFLEDNPEIMEEISARVWKALIPEVEEKSE